MYKLSSYEIYRRSTHFHQGEESRLEGLLLGADDYISKPFTSRQLVARTHLQMQIGKRKAELEAKFENSTGELRVLSELAPVGFVLSLAS